MKIVTGYNFEAPEKIMKKYSLNESWLNREERRMISVDPEMVEYAENEIINHPESEYEIVMIPDKDVTDWYIHEYDGSESVYFVFHGKMYEAYEDHDDRDDAGSIGKTMYHLLSTYKPAYLMI